MWSGALLPPPPPLLLLLPLLLLGLLASSSACPDSCQCHAPLIECHARKLNLAELERLPPSFTQLKLYDLHQPTVRFDEAISSKFIRNLEVLEVTNSEIRGIMTEMSKHSVNRTFAENLRSLNISHNDLKQIRHTVLMDKLRILDLSHNEVEYLVAQQFAQMPNLTWLSLAGNDLHLFDPHAFGGIESLEFLDLSDNSLFCLNDIISQLTSLQRLIVAGNKLKEVKVDWFKNLAKLVELDIARNKLIFIPAETLQPLPSLSVFKLAENPLIDRDLSLLLSTGRRLEIVDASRIGLSRVPATLTRSIRTLKLAGNRLTSIDSGDLDNYPLLKLLDLSNNRLTIIEEDALGRLDNLEELILSGNILPNIPNSLPSSLKILDLRQNAISSLEANGMLGLRWLKDLNLSGNVISVIEGGFFHQVPGLQILDISDNPIKKLPSDTLSGPSNLMVLRMSGLISLEIEANRNQDTAFPILTPERLVTLDVSRSPTLAAQLLADNAALSACKSLQELDLSFTNISAIRSDLNYVLPQLQKLNVIGNEWNCDANQLWLGEWMRQHRNSIEFSTRCKTPQSLEGKLLEEMPSIISQTTTTKVVEEHKFKPISQTFEIEVSTPDNEVVQKSQMKKLNSESTSISPELLKNVKDSIENSTDLNDSTKIMNVTSRSTSTMAIPISRQSQETTTVNVKGKDEAQVTQSIEYNIKKVILTTNAEESSTLSAATISEDYFSRDINLKSKVPLTGGLALTIPEKNSQNVKQTSTTAAKHTPTTNNINKMVANDFTTRKSISPKVEITSGEPLISSPTSYSINYVGTDEMLKVKRKQPILIEKQGNLIDNHENTDEDLSVYNEKSVNQLFSEMSSRSKLLADTQPRIKLRSIAEELNSQAMESGARTSESLTTGAHPGMLILLGAAIGAAAALTVVLSRRATVNRRDRQYQRHENIEVHALTPTTELW